MRAIVFSVFLFLLLTISWCQDENCVYGAKITSQGPCEGQILEACNSWDNLHNTPSGYCLSFVFDDNCKAQTKGQCTELCSAKMLGKSTAAVVFRQNGEQVEFTTFERLDYRNYTTTLCPRKPDPGTKLVYIGQIGVDQIQIPESCEYHDEEVRCGPACEPPPPPPVGGECLYTVQIKTSCKAFSGNPFGTVSVVISDDVGWSGDEAQLAGHLVSFRALDNPGVPDFTLCTLAEFKRQGTCINFCAMKLVLEDTGVKWRVDYVKVSSKYVSKKFGLYETLRPSHDTARGDYAEVLAILCKAVQPPKSIKINTDDIIIPEQCNFKPTLDYGDGYYGALECPCLHGKQWLSE